MFASLTVYGAIVPAGWFLTIYKEIDNCLLAVYSSTELLAIAICGIILVSLSLVVWAMLLCIYDKTTDPS